MRAPVPTPVDAASVSLGNLLRAWGDAGEAPPTAIVAGIVHELAAHGTETEPRSDAVDVDAVVIGADGQVTSETAPTVAALAELLDVGLAGCQPGRTGDLMPPGARAGIDRFRGWDGAHEDGCAAVADWLREAFGPLPEPAEIARCARASAPLDPESPTSLPTAAPMPEPELREALSEPPGEPLEIPAEVSSDSLEPTHLGSAHPVELGASRVPEAPEAPTPEDAAAIGSMDLSGDVDGATDSSDVDSSSGERPVVRKELPRREHTVSVVRAPAARRSARPLADRGDSILVPADGGNVRGWLLLLLGVGIAVGLYFLLTA